MARGSSADAGSDAGSDGQQCRQCAPPHVQLPAGPFCVPAPTAEQTLAEELPVPRAGGPTFSSEDTPGAQGVLSL